MWFYIQITFLLFTFLLLGCNKKRGAPYCFSCEKGKLYYSVGCKDSPLFVSEKGDSVYLRTRLAKKFHKDGISVCVSQEKKTGLLSWGCGTREVKCITKIK